MNKNTNVKSSMIAVTIAAGLFSGAVFALTPVQLTDTDGDGVISAEEITAARAAYKSELLAQFDVDGNGELSRTERRAMKDARYDATLVNFDADGDGELSRAERRAAKEARRAETEAMLDVNGDGEVSAEEAAGFEAVKQERGEGRHGKRAKKGGKRGAAATDES